MKTVQCIYCGQKFEMSDFFTHSLHISRDIRDVTVKCPGCGKSVQVRMCRFGFISYRIGESPDATKNLITVPNIKARLKHDKSGITLVARSDNGEEFLNQYIPFYRAEYRVEYYSAPQADRDAVNQTRESFSMDEGTDNFKWLKTDK